MSSVFSLGLFDRQILIHLNNGRTQKISEICWHPWNCGGDVHEDKEVHDLKFQTNIWLVEKKKHKSCVCQFRVFSGPATTRYFCVRSQLRFLPWRGIQLDRAAVCYFSSHHSYCYCCYCPILHHPISVHTVHERDGCTDIFVPILVFLEYSMWETFFSEVWFLTMQNSMHTELPS